MDSETLDRLLMDRALGALAADTDALLARYLEHDGAAAARAREFATAATAARLVLAKAAPAGLPPFPALRVQKVEQARQRLWALRYVAGIAAALIVGLGLGIGFSAGRGHGPDSAMAPAPRLASAGPARTPRDFWSMQRLYDDARGARRSESIRLIWDSAVSLPKRGDES
jgi:anti-sigma factor RsiW